MTIHLHASRLRPLLLVLLGVLLLGNLPAMPAHAQAIAGGFSSTEPVAQPLRPVEIVVSLPGYEGTATLVVYDANREPVGNWEFAVAAGGATVTVIPRGKLGEHIGVLYANGQEVARAPLYRLDATSTVRTGIPQYDELYTRIQSFMLSAQLAYLLDGKWVHGYRSPDSPLLWLRDHYYQGRAFKYFDPDVTSLLDAFQRAQYPNGSLPDFVARPEFYIDAYRTPVEADVEYLYVLAVYEAWQMNGDDAWMLSHLNSMQRAINYTLTDPLRWQPQVGLVMRPFTIDTWDFEYGPTTTDPISGKPAPRHWIDSRTRWGIFHGDNTGLAQALMALAQIEDYVGQPANATAHRELAREIINRLNAWAWNGNFYTHHVKFQPYDVPGVDEAKQLSLSNAKALNRNVLTIEQGRAILDEYRSRLQQPDRIAFAEWFSIDPPFPPGSYGLAGRLGELPGEYVNGGIMPLVGGELARGAFRFGYEDYGFDILERYFTLIDRDRQTFLWYYPTGGPGIHSPDTLPTDGWGASAMMGGLMEGAAGIEELGVRYSDVLISPRWSVKQEVTQAYIVARYAASQGYVAYQWYLTNERGSTFLRMEVTGSGEIARIRMMLPPNTRSVRNVSVNGQAADYEIEQIGTSQYVALAQPVDVTVAQIEVELRTR